MQASLDERLLRYEFYDALVRTAAAVLVHGPSTRGAPSTTAPRASTIPQGLYTHPETASSRTSDQIPTAVVTGSRSGLAAGLGGLGAATSTRSSSSLTGVLSGPQPTTVSAALEEIIVHRLAVAVPIEALHDVNVYRECRLYSQAVEAVLQAHLPVLQAQYGLLAVKARGKCIRLEEWMDMLDSYSMLGRCDDPTNTRTTRHGMCA